MVCGPGVGTRPALTSEPGEIGGLAVATRHRLRGALGIALVSALLVAADVLPRPKNKDLSRPVPLAIARVKLLMDAINGPGFVQFDQVLRGQPTAAQTWQGISDRAVLMAECGNLLLLRPPRGKQAGTWLDRATELRKDAVELGNAADQHDYAAARKAVVALADSCMHCHQTFHVPVRVSAFAPQPIQPANAPATVPLAPPLPAVPQPPPPPPPP